MQVADVHAAIRTAKDASFLRDGQGSEWLGEAVAGGTGRKPVAARVAQLCSWEERSLGIRLTKRPRLPTETKCYL
jgi:hypothetical protein